MDNRRIFEFLEAKLDAGQSCILVTVIAVEGSSMRDIGAHMGVCADGSFAGSLSGGCIENAVVAEALGALSQGQPRITRFGTGSPYIDIKLPCGGGLDIHFLPITDATFISECVGAISKRQPFSLSLPIEEGTAKYIDHWPAPKLLIIGHGAAVTSLAKLARSMDLDAAILSSDPMLTQHLTKDGHDAALLTSARDTSPLASDPWTAIIFLFHDHDWESHLVQRAFALPHFYIGAMGGRKAHAARIASLLELGVDQAAIDTIKAPIGLFHSSRDPDSLALSALAQVIEYYQSYDFSKSRCQTTHD
jgi:xanthine dehydrogenase accessory factor